jgi:hypothetical protein
MNWLSSFYLTHPEYRRLRVAKRSPCSVHFELEPGLYEAHFQIKPIYERTGQVWLPAGSLASLGRLTMDAIRNPRLAFEMAMALPFATVFTDGYGGTTWTAKDSYIRPDSPNSNYGTNAYIQVRDNANSNELRVLLQFDTFSVSTAATVSTSNCITRAYGQGVPIDIFRGLQSWTESGVTWNKYNGTNAWPGAAGGLAGTDYSATKELTWTPYNGVTPGQQCTFAIPVMTQVWVTTPAANFGMWWIAETTKPGQRDDIFSSDNTTDQSYSPELQVTYTLPAGGSKVIHAMAGSMGSIN